MDGSDLRRRAEACRQQAMKCADPVDRAVWLRLANHWDDIDRDDDVPTSTTRGAP